MVLVPANMSRFGFSPCKQKLLFLLLQNILFLKIIPKGTNIFSLVIELIKNGIIVLYMD